MCVLTPAFSVQAFAKIRKQIPTPSQSLSDLLSPPKMPSSAADMQAAATASPEQNNADNIAFQQRDAKPANANTPEIAMVVGASGQRDAAAEPPPAAPAEVPVPPDAQPEPGRATDPLGESPKRPRITLSEQEAILKLKALKQEQETLSEVVNKFSEELAEEKRQNKVRFAACEEELGKVIQKRFTGLKEDVDNERRKTDQKIDKLEVESMKNHDALKLFKVEIKKAREDLQVGKNTQK